jgi:SOS-response transcriptional repressor LexA
MSLNGKEVGSRLREFGESNFKSLSKLAERLGMKPQSLQKYLNGTSIPGGEIIARLIDLGCDINWLFYGDDLQLRAYRKEILYPQEFKLLGRIPAGYADYNDLSEWPEREKLEYDPDTHFFLKVDEEFGYSMMPLVSPGDLVLVSMEAKIKSGDLVAALWDKTKGALKIYNENKDIPDIIVLNSYNQAVEPIFLKKTKVKLYKVVLIEKRG